MDENDRISLEMGRAAFGITHTQPTDHAAQLAARDAEIERLQAKADDWQAMKDERDALRTGYDAMLADQKEVTSLRAEIAALKDEVTTLCKALSGYGDEIITRNAEIKRLREALGRVRDETLNGRSDGIVDRIYAIVSGAITAAALKEDTNG